MPANDANGGAGDRLPYRRSDGGDLREASCRSDFASLLRASALVKMAKCKSKTLDESDFSAAYDELLANSRPDWICQGIGAALLLFGGICISWGLNLLCIDDPNPHKNQGWGLLSAGIALGLTGGFVQYWPMRKS